MYDGPEGGQYEKGNMSAPSRRLDPSQIGRQLDSAFYELWRSPHVQAHIFQLHVGTSSRSGVMRTDQGKKAWNDVCPGLSQPGPALHLKAGLTSLSFIFRRSTPLDTNTFTPGLTL